MYWNCLVIGLFLLLISLLLDGLGDLFQGLSFFDIHFNFLPGILPLSPLQICAFLVGFGGMGMISDSILFAILFGLFLAYGTHIIVDKLKKANYGIIIRYDLLGRKGKVITTIFKDGIGNVSIDTRNGQFSYPAKSNHTIQEGKFVQIIGIQGETLIVTDDITYFFNLHC